MTGRGARTQLRRGDRAHRYRPTQTYAGGPYASVPQTSGNYFSCADHSSIRPSTAFDLRIALRASSWSVAALKQLASKAVGTTAFVIGLDTSGALRLYASANGSSFWGGTSAASAVVSSLFSTSDVCVKITWRQSDGRCRFEWKTTTAPSAAADNASNSGWTFINDATYGAGQSFYANTGAFIVGGDSAGGSQIPAFTLYHAQLATSIDGAPACSLDLANATTSTWTDPQGRTWTTNATASGLALVNADNIAA